MASRIPLKGGAEYDALTKGGKRVHSFRAGVRKSIKRGYNKRARQEGKSWLI